MTPPRLRGIDHFVLTVADIGATCAFYERAVGARVETFGAGRTALILGAQKINLHQAGRAFRPHAQTPTPGSGDFCLITETPIEAVIGHLERAGIAIEEGPVRRSGAQGPILSVYVRDPDGNLVEIGQPLGAGTATQVQQGGNT